MRKLWTLRATLRVVLKSTACGFGFSQAVAKVSDRAEHDRAVADGPAVVISRKADRFASQRLVDVNCAAIPSDLAIVADPPDFLLAVIIRLAQHTIEATWREGVVLAGGGVTQCAVRAFLVVEALEVVQTLKLLAQASAPADWRRPAAGSDACAHGGRSAAVCRERCAAASRRP